MGDETSYVMLHQPDFEGGTRSLRVVGARAGRIGLRIERPTNALGYNMSPDEARALAAGLEAAAHAAEESLSGARVVAGEFAKGRATREELMKALNPPPH